MRNFPRPAASRPRWLRALVAVGCPVVATLGASTLSRTTTTMAAMFYLLAVVVAAVFGGQAGGLGASILSFLGLNVFFTPPVGTFRVQKTEDVVALLAFLGVSGLTATLLTRAKAEKARAERREQETSFMYGLASRLLAGDRLETVLDQFAQNLVDLFDLAHCEVHTVDLGKSRLISSAGEIGPGLHAQSVRIALRTERGEFGEIRITAKHDGAFGAFERSLADTFAAQLALAIESARLDMDRRTAEAEAQASKIRAALFSSVTHDLRTPLASIKASATSLLDEGVRFEAGQRSELLTTIVEETDRLNHLIGNLLDLSRLRAGALAPNKTPTAIEEVVEGVVARLRMLLSGREVTIRIREDTPLVPMDVMQIDQVLTNLLENAIKYTPQGSQLEIKAGKWQSSVEVHVADRGHGIPKEEREKVFEEFVTRDVDGRKGGTGLGLAIARAMVTAHGGEIWIKDTPGGGATVGFRLPVDSGGFAASGARESVRKGAATPPDPPL